MTEENLKYLKDNIKYMGFGENLNAQLENNLTEGKDAFQLGFRAEVNKKPFEATLHFGKSANTDMYFFNSYNASLQKSNGEKVRQRRFCTSWLLTELCPLRQKTVTTNQLWQFKLFTAYMMSLQSMT